MQEWTRRALLKTASAAAIGTGLSSSVPAFSQEPGRIEAPEAGRPPLPQRGR